MKLIRKNCEFQKRRKKGRKKVLKEYGIKLVGFIFLFRAYNEDIMKDVFNELPDKYV